MRIESYVMQFLMQNIGRVQAIHAADSQQNSKTHLDEDHEGEEEESKGEM